MKKLLSVMLLVSFVLCMSCGCGEEAEYYNVTVTGETLDLKEPIQPQYRAGEVVEIRCNTLHDASIYVFVNGEKIPRRDVDLDYWSYQFIMPAQDITIYLTMDRFYGRDTYEMKELCRWGDYVDIDLERVSVKMTDYSDPNSLIVNQYSSKKADLDSFQAILEQRLIKVERNVDTMVRSEYRFHYAGERHYELRFYGAIFIPEEELQTFGFHDPSYALPTIETPDLVTYSFQYDGLSSDIKKYGDDSFSMQYTRIDEAEFVPYEGPAIDSAPEIYLDSRYGKINLLTPTVFEMNGNYYRVVTKIESWAYTYFNLHCSE